jgi:hypothetical protein
MNEETLRIYRACALTVVAATCFASCASNDQRCTGTSSDATCGALAAAGAGNGGAPGTGGSEANDVGGGAGTHAAGAGPIIDDASGGGAGTSNTTDAAATDASASATDAGGIGQDIPPWRDLNVTSLPGQHTHTTPSGQTAGFDNRAAKMQAKLVIDLGVVTGSYQAYLGKRGFHVMGITDGNDCVVNNWAMGRDFDGNCRLNTLDGQAHGDQSTVKPEQSIMAQVLNALTQFDMQFPEEGWGYYLTQDKKAVRWSDVILTGSSHGATNAIVFAHQLRVYRAIAQSGPRDNTCGKGTSTTDYDPNNPPYWPIADTCDATHCCIGHVASWIDSPSATPIDRYYGFTGKQDDQYGDIMYTMERMQFVGQPVNISTATAPYGGSHRFYADTGHSAFPGGFPVDAMNIALDVLPENRNPTF